jgi:vacuolar-type H+-ATPase subunit E/Vma4
LDEEWRAKLEAATTRKLVLRFDGPAAGCITQSADGAVTFDNSVAARSRRLAPVWRPALARIYDAAVQARAGSGTAAVAGAA